jgi:hypothetical protein
MKKPLAMVTKTIAAALGLLLLAACANPFITPRERDNPAGEGRGLVRIETGAGPARTALPSAVFDHYEYAFSYNGNPAPAIEPVTAGGDVFELEPGNWTVTINAYAGPGNDTLAAQGSGVFSVTLGEQTEVTIKLSPIVSGGTGTLNYALTYPDGATLSSFTLTLLAGTDGIELKGGAVSGSLAGTLTVDSGYYLARAVVQKDGVTAGKNEVVHIYRNMATGIALEFVDDHFKAIVVVSSADSGPGTLREALTGILSTDGVDGSTIRIDLPEGDRVITLSDVLPQITKSLVIEGNGATLTQSGFAESNTSQLLYVLATAEVRINRLHFKGGRGSQVGGAVYNAGRLTLESCIFSDNQVNGSSAQGGAIYTTSSGTPFLTVLGCTFYGNSAGTLGTTQGGAIYFSAGKGTLTGNIFWENTAQRLTVVSGSPASGGFNVSDKASGTNNTTGSGWTFTNGDVPTSSLPFSRVSFRPLEGSDALNRITTRPAGYPTLDFYGVAIPETNAAAGAAQTAATGTGYFLDYASIGPGAISITGGTVDDDGFAGDFVTLTAQDGANGVFRRWIVDDGTERSELSNPLDLDITGDTTVRAVFYTKITSVTDSGPGSLREVLAGISDGGGIVFPEGETITLNTPLSVITKNIVIEGNGATLTQSGFTESSSSQLLSIGVFGAGPEVHISRLHFKGGRATTNGAAIYMDRGTLTLESCVFSDNRTSGSGAMGGAIYSSVAVLTVSGSAFYGNSAGTTGSSLGGAIFSSISTVTTLTGNIFWGNTAVEGSVVYVIGSNFTSGGFNVSDKESGTDNTTGSGWDFTNGDKKASSLPISSVSFRPIGSEALNVIGARPEGYPRADFYGEDIPEINAAAGVAQTAATGSGYFLDYASQGPGAVNVTGGTVDDDGFANGPVTLTASEGANGAFRYWIVNEAKHGEPSNVLALTISGDTVVRAVFYTKVTSAGNGGPGSLREALATVGDGDGIVLPAGETITLAAPLGQIGKSMIIEGNGATLTQSGFAESDASQLLYINGDTAEVRISRLHFKGGRAANYGGAIRNTGTLILESCVFSDNRTSASNGDGGAIHTAGAMASVTISGSTFYGNSAGTSKGRGGVVFIGSGSATLTGNVFWGNTAAQYSVITNGSVVSGGFNVSDKEDGSDPALGSGWTFTNGDKQAASWPVSPLNFKPIAGGDVLSVIGARPWGYPETDFYGAAVPVTHAAAGAAQTATAGTGYFLDYASQGPGAVSASGGAMDDDGLLSVGSSITLTAHQTGAKGTFMHWTIDGSEVDRQSPPDQLVVIMDDHKTVRAVFYTQVTSAGNSGTGSLREVLEAAAGGDGIILPAGQTITLTSPLPEITRNIAINGNGATLTQSGLSSPLLQINSNVAEVRVSRLHFKGGRVSASGGAIYNNGGILTLESCVFTDNQAGNGGALYILGSTASVTVSGCTFYGNSATARGGAIYVAAGETLNLMGNIFQGNTANSSSVVCYSGGATTGGYNISDRADGYADDAVSSGWDFAATDTQASFPISPVSLKPVRDGEALNLIPTRPPAYPARDFYDEAIPLAGAAAGAIQTATAGAGYFLDYASQGPGVVTATNMTVDEDGLTPRDSTVTLTALANDNVALLRWIVNGVETEAQTSLDITMNDHKIVRAVFGFAVTSAANAGEGSLREVLAAAGDGDTIFLSVGGPIILTTSLPQIDKSLVIEGNGATLTQSGMTVSLLRITSSGNVRVSRLHFKGGAANTTGGGAIYNNGGILTLESCIFSNNRAANVLASGGGAIANHGTTAVLTVSGCTFYENSATDGAVIYFDRGIPTLTGNIFWGNTGNRTVFDRRSSGVTGGHNVSDLMGGTANNTSGWAFDKGDVQLAGVSFDDELRPFHPGLPVIPSPPLGNPDLFPLYYFDGTLRGTTPGAMPAQAAQ